MHVTSDDVSTQIVAEVVPPPMKQPEAAASDLATPAIARDFSDDDTCTPSNAPFYVHTERGELFNIPCRYYPNCWYNNKCKYLHEEKQVSKPAAKIAPKQKTSMADQVHPSDKSIASAPPKRSRLCGHEAGRQDRTGRLQHQGHHPHGPAAAGFGQDGSA